MADLMRRPMQHLSKLGALLIAVVLAIALSVPVETAGATKTLSGLVRISGMTIGLTDTVILNPTVNTTVESSGSIIVYGTLDTRPSPGIKHAIVFVNIDEAKYIGGDSIPPMSGDVGLWFQDNGRCLCEGQPKTSWLNAAGALTAGQTQITLKSAPTGWSPGDDLAIAPTLPPTVPKHYDAYDYPKVRSVSGAIVNLDRALVFGHPAVTVVPGRVMTAEVMNLTRSVRFESLPNARYAADPLRKHMIGRAHIMFNRILRPQSIKYVEIRYMGPQRPRDANNNIGIVLGRYALHFHKAYDAVRGSLIEGTVLRDLGNHGYVMHASNGVTLRGTVLHNGYQNGYWWDLVAGAPGEKFWANASHDVLYENCIGSRVYSFPDYRGGRNAMFTVNGGTRNMVRGCVAVGMGNAIDASGMHWPEGESVEADRYANPFKQPSGVWAFHVLPALGYSFLSHNHRGDGLFGWQNTANVHPFPDGFISYHNGGFGWDHGAYSNPYQWTKTIYFANAAGAFNQRAMANNETTAAQIHTDILCDQANLFPYCVVLSEHTLNSGAPQWIRPIFKNYRVAAVYVGPKDGQRNSGKWIVRDPVFQTAVPGAVEFKFDASAHLGTYIIVRSASLGNFTLRHPASTVAGCVYVPKWNAKRCL